MERADYENIVRLLPNAALVAFMMEVNATDMHDGNEPDVAYTALWYWDELVELQAFVAKNLMEHYEGDGEAVAEYLDENIKAGKALVREVVKKRAS